MIYEHRGDLFGVKNGIIVHGCNSLGIMGAGVAAIVKRVYPQAYLEYLDWYQLCGLNLGDVIMSRTPPRGPDEEILIANAITQDEVGNDPKRVYVSYTAVRSAFEKVLVVARLHELPVHFPLIGCGLANGDWKIISKIIDDVIPDNLGKHLWILP